MTTASATVDSVVSVESIEPPMRRAKAKGNAWLTLGLAILALVWVAPLFLLVLTSIRPLSDFVAQGPLAWPKEFTSANFQAAWRTGNFATTYRNTALIALVKVPLGVFLASLLAYAIAKLRLPGRRAVMYLVFLGLTAVSYTHLTLPTNREV